MRNISFDESTVLTEFAKIMNDQDLVKQAAGPRDMPYEPLTSQPAPEIQTGVPLTMPDIGEKKDIPLPNEKPEIPTAQFMIRPELVAPLKAQITKSLSEINTNPGSYAQHKSNFDNMLGDYLAKKLMDEVTVNSLKKDFEQKAQQLVKRQSVEDETVKQAASDKLYDISGETGEDLVDQAHPGGGTATEVTNSKTKENLVETIIEQQERDIAVVNKMPKGTYAAVVDTLVALADKLDAQGLRKEADAIDKIIELYKPAQKKNEDGIVKEAEPPFKDVPYFTPPAVSAPAAVQQKVPEIYEGLYPQSRLDQPPTGMTGQEPKLEPIPAVDKKTEKFQNWYNDSLAKIRQKLTKEQAKNFSDILVGLKIDALAPDNKWGPKTRTAWKLVQSYGGMKNFVNALAGKLVARPSAQTNMKLTAPAEYLGGKEPKTVSQTPTAPPAMPQIGTTAVTFPRQEYKK